MHKKNIVFKTGVVLGLLSAVAPAVTQTVSAASTYSKSQKALTKSGKYAKFTLRHNAYVYNKKGKRVGKTVLRKGNTFKAESKKIYSIKGKKYYRVGKDLFVKAANVAHSSTVTPTTPGTNNNTSDNTNTGTTVNPSTDNNTVAPGTGTGTTPSTNGQGFTNDPAKFVTAAKAAKANIESYIADSVRAINRNTTFSPAQKTAALKLVNDYGNDALTKINKIIADPANAGEVYLTGYNQQSRFTAVNPIAIDTWINAPKPVGSDLGLMDTNGSTGVKATFTSIFNSGSTNPITGYVNDNIRAFAARTAKLKEYQSTANITAINNIVNATNAKLYAISDTDTDAFNKVTTAITDGYNEILEQTKTFPDAQKAAVNAVARAYDGIVANSDLGYVANVYGTLGLTTPNAQTSAAKSYINGASNATDLNTRKANATAVAAIVSDAVSTYSNTTLTGTAKTALKEAAMAVLSDAANSAKYSDPASIQTDFNTAKANIAAYANTVSQANVVLASLHTSLATATQQTVTESTSANDIKGGQALSGVESDAVTKIQIEIPASQPTNTTAAGFIAGSNPSVINDKQNVFNAVYTVARSMVGDASLTASDKIKVAANFSKFVNDSKDSSKAARSDLMNNGSGDQAKIKAFLNA